MSTSLPRRESTQSDVIDLRPWDLPVTLDDLDVVLSWLAHD
jgi:hypothetical protein